MTSSTEHSSATAPIEPTDLLDDPTTLERLRVAVLRMARRIRLNSPAGVTASQLSALGTVARNQPLSVSALAAREHMRAPSASKIVASLERSGFVERQTDPHDRRVHHIVLSPSGIELVNTTREAGRGWLHERLEHLSDDDVTAIANALPALERLLDS